MNFYEEAQSSAEAYLFLVQEKKLGGFVNIPVDKIERDSIKPHSYEYWLYAAKPKSIDGLIICIDGVKYSESSLEPLLYDETKRALKIRINDMNVKESFSSTDPSSVKIISDLTFLIKRVKNWYEQYGDKIKIPDRKPVIPFVHIAGTKEPSIDQTAAIEGLLSQPFSYVWGAPGTGKTKCVLSQAVLSYLKAGKRVLITAPTNNAVEQTLHGLLEVMERTGLDYEKYVIRLGMASSSFQKRYPGVCEKVENEKRIKELKKLIGYYQEQLSCCLDNKRKLEKHTDAVRKLNSVTEYKEKVYIYLNKIRSAYNDIYNELNSLASLTDQQRRNEQETERLLETIEYYKETINGLFDKRKSALGRLIAAVQGRNLKKELENALDARRHFEKQIEECKTKKTELLGEHEKTNGKIALERMQAEIVVCQLLNTLSFSKELQDKCEQINEANYGVILDGIDMEIQSYIAGLKKIIEDNSTDKELSLQRIEEEEQNCRNALNNKTLELQDAEANETSKRIEKCLIIAATIDTCLGRLAPEKGKLFSHVFLDEAGYCSLIKAVPLTAYDCPVTLLGDHMQLTPVHEANETDISNNKAICFWAQSSLFAETVFTKSTDDIYNDYVENQLPPFSIMKKYTLYHTYRFGQSLASILSGTVYDERFEGNPDKRTQVYYIDAKRMITDKDRESSGEVSAIANVLKNNQGLLNDVGIITPYKDQYALLAKTIKGALNCKILDEIVTVHRSQGREWKTVILSVVDTTKKWFTDSNNLISKGKNVINTAVSRAIDRLIIVCDHDYWTDSSQQSQLIYKLLSIAEPYNSLE